MDISLRELHEVIGGRLRLGSPPPRDGELAVLGPVVSDSRELRPGEVFWGLTGSHCNGAEYAVDAMQRGAMGVVVADYSVEPWAGAFSIEVEDTKLALWQLADWNRHRFQGFTVAVTGSVGKTTARQMIDAVLRPVGEGVVSARNYNNEIGVPLTLLRLASHHRYAVLELGARARGEIDALARLTAPHVGVITRIGDAHLGPFGDQQRIAAAKGELLAALEMDAHAVLCGDDLWLRRLATNCRAAVVWFGRSGDCDVTPTEIRHSGGMLRFRVAGHPFAVPVWGRHFLEAALAAIGVGLVYGRSLDEMAAALADFQPMPMRCEVIATGRGTIINDTYNSSPLAMRAALKMLFEQSTQGRRIVLAGDMGDLGEHAPVLHRELGTDIVTLSGADLLFACGEHAGCVVEAARAAGMRSSRAVAIADPVACGESVREQMSPGDVLLVKGSRAMGLEKIVESLVGQPLAKAA